MLNNNAFLFYKKFKRKQIFNIQYSNYLLLKK